MNKLSLFWRDLWFIRIPFLQVWGLFFLLGMAGQGDFLKIIYVSAAFALGLSIIAVILVRTGLYPFSKTQNPKS